MSQNPTNDANLLTQRWRPGFGTAANEERVLTYHFLDASDGATKGINNQLNLRKISIASSQALASNYVGTSNLTYNTLTDLVVPVTPLFDYSAVEIALNLLSRIDDEAALQAAYKKQIMAALATTLDARGGVLVSTLVTNVTGGAGSQFDKPLFFDSWNKIIVSGRDHFKPGQTKAHCVLYNKQSKNLMNVAEFTYQYMRGDSVNPLVRGWVNESMNTTIEESGNVYTSGGVAHNPVFLDDAFAYAFNLRPMLLEPQAFQAVVRIIAVQEPGLAVYWDEYACDMQTSSA